MLLSKLFAISFAKEIIKSEADYDLFDSKDAGNLVGFLNEYIKFSSVQFVSKFKKTASVLAKSYKLNLKKCYCLLKLTEIHIPSHLKNIDAALHELSIKIQAYLVCIHPDKLRVLKRLSDNHSEDMGGLCEEFIKDLNSELKSRSHGSSNSTFFYKPVQNDNPTFKISGYILCAAFAAVYETFYGQYESGKPLPKNYTPPRTADEAVKFYETQEAVAAMEENSKKMAEAKAKAKELSLPEGQLESTCYGAHDDSTAEMDFELLIIQHNDIPHTKRVTTGKRVLDLFRQVDDRENHDTKNGGDVSPSSVFDIFKPSHSEIKSKRLDSSDSDAESGSEGNSYSDDDPCNFFTGAGFSPLR